jgi:hypothetical protein
MEAAPPKIRPFAGFQSSLPTDTIETDEEIIQVGGKTVAEEIGKILIRLGADVNEPVLEGECGWRFGVRYGGRKLSCQVVHIEMFHLTFYDGPATGSPIVWPAKAYAEILTNLAEELDRDPRFWDIRWYDDGDDAIRLDDEPGAARPID